MQTGSRPIGGARPDGSRLDETIETKVGRLLTLVEPVMLVVMGFLVAMLLVSIYLPMFGAFSQVGN